MHPFDPCSHVPHSEGEYIAPSDIFSGEFGGFALCYLRHVLKGYQRLSCRALAQRLKPKNINFGELYTYAERASAAYASKSVIRSKYPSTVRISSPDQTDVRYFLERNDKTRTQTITVRGTANNKNFSEDLKESGVREHRKTDIPVHAGFDLAARAIYDDVSPYLKPGYKTYVTGHFLAEPLRPF